LEEKSSTSSGVLLIDDNALQLRVREMVLRDAGFQVAIATSAEAAMSMLKSGRGVPDAGAPVIDAVVTDHMLTGASGADLVRELRDSWPALPVIVITGMPEVEEEYQGMSVHFRPKPYPPDDLIDLLRACIKARAD
jgi:DNA-binding response OmpR family regulator